MERQVILKSMIDSLVSVRKPEFGINRRWQKMGQTQAMPFEQVEQLLWDNGFRNMIDSGILYIEDLQTKKDLGLEPEDATIPVNIIVLNEKQMETYLTTLSLDVFKREVSRLPQLQVDNLISYAIQHRYTDSGKSAFLKELTGKDILKIVSREIEMEEEDKLAREREDNNRRNDGRR